MVATTVTLIHEDLSTEAQATDEEGRASFDHPGTGWIMARPPATFAVTAVVKPSQAHYVLTIRESPCSVGGILYIDGRPAGAGNRLLIKMSLSRWSAVPWSTIKKLAKGDAPNSFFTVTDAEGRFTVRGLELGDGFYLTLPSDLIIADRFPYAGSDTAYVSHICKARTSIEVHAVHAPALRGRCLDASGTPLSDVEVTVRGIVAGRRRRIAPPLSSNAHGEFRLAMDFGSWLPVTLEARWAGVVVRSDPVEAAWTGEKVLPPLVFPVAVPLEVSVRDEDGNPIPFAKVGIRGQRKLVIDVDAEGRAILQLPPGRPIHVQVAAWGYQFVDREVQAQESGPGFDVTMKPSNILRIRLSNETGRTVAERPLELIGPVEMLKNDNAWESAAYLATSPDIVRRKRKSSAYFMASTDSQGEVRFYDLAENQSFRAVTRAHDNIILAQTDSIRLQTGEHRRLDLVLPNHRTSSVFGKVVDEAGDPIANVHVRISQSVRGYGGTGATSDFKGHFTIKQVAVDAAYFNASKPGYIPERIFLEGLLTRKEPLRFVLRRALECEIEVRNADGSLAPGATVHFPYRRDGGEALVDRRGDGTFHVRNLSDKPVTFRVKHGYAPALRVELNPVNEAIKVVRLPPEGRLRVRWDQDPETRDFVIYWAETEHRGFPLSAMWTKDSAGTNLPAGRYRVGRAKSVGGRFEFAETPRVVDIHAGDEVNLTID